MINLLKPAFSAFASGVLKKFISLLICWFINLIKDSLVGHIPEHSVKHFRVALGRSYHCQLAKDSIFAGLIDINLLTASIQSIKNLHQRIVLQEISISFF